MQTLQQKHYCIVRLWVNSMHTAYPSLVVSNNSSWLHRIFRTVCLHVADAVMIFETVIVNNVTVVLTSAPAVRLFKVICQIVDCQCLQMGLHYSNLDLIKGLLQWFSIALSPWKKEKEEEGKKACYSDQRILPFSRDFRKLPPEPQKEILYIFLRLNAPHDDK